MNPLAQLPETHRRVIKLAVADWTKQLAAQAKKDEDKFGIDPNEHEELAAVAESILSSLGWTPPEKKKKAKKDPAQMEIPGAGEGPPTAPRIQCTKCAGRHAVPTHDATVECPDCGALHHVRVSDDGILVNFVHVEVPPDHIAALLLRQKDPKLKKLTSAEKVKLEKWTHEHPHYTTAPELAVAGERVANPDVPGTGNPLRIVCSEKSGRECDGFDTFDTPGKAQCPHCAQPYKVEIVEGRLNVTTWSLEDEAKERGD